jgi:hypothetical protein
VLFNGSQGEGKITSPIERVQRTQEHERTCGQDWSCASDEEASKVGCSSENEVTVCGIDIHNVNWLQLGPGGSHLYMHTRCYQTVLRGIPYLFPCW